MPHITKSGMEAWQVPLPPKNEQSRIVTAIESLQLRSARARILLSDLRPKLDNLRQSILQAAFSGRLTADWRAKNPDVEPADVLLDRIRTERRQRWEAAELEKYEAKCKKPPKNWQDRYKEPEPVDEEGVPELPEGWCSVGVHMLLDINRPGIKTGPFGSLLKKHEHQTCGIPVVGIENIGKMKFIKGSKIHISENKAKDLDGYDVLPGDILISRSGTVGEICVAPSDLGTARFSTNIMRIVLNSDAMRPEFMGYLLKALKL